MKPGLGPTLPSRTRYLRLLAALLTVTAISGCNATGGTLQPPGPGTDQARRLPLHAVADDGYRLPLRHWSAEGDATKAVVLAVHGFNDHSGSFEVLAEALTPQGIEIYAHDQRGHGTTAQRGLWPGQERLADDVTLLAGLLRERHPDTPLYLVGKSMGAAVVILSLTGDDPPSVTGSVLIAPAVWGFEAMPWYQRLGLWLGIRLAPSLTLSGRAARRLGIEPTDDPEIKAQLAEDPLMLRRARIDTLHGLTVAMSRALASARELPGPSLLLYGGKDEVIPPEAICALVERLPEDDTLRFAFYPEGYHMLTRYTKREQTEADIAAWLHDPSATLPSGHEVERQSARRLLCQE